MTGEPISLETLWGIPMPEGELVTQGPYPEEDGAEVISQRDSETRNRDQVSTNENVTGSGGPGLYETGTFCSGSFRPLL